MTTKTSRPSARKCFHMGSPKQFYTRCVDGAKLVTGYTFEDAGHRFGVYKMPYLGKVWELVDLESGQGIAQGETINAAVYRYTDFLAERFDALTKELRYSEWCAEFLELVASA